MAKSEVREPKSLGDCISRPGGTAAFLWRTFTRRRNADYSQVSLRDQMQGSTPLKKHGFPNSNQTGGAARSTMPFPTAYRVRLATS